MVILICRLKRGGMLKYVLGFLAVSGVVSLPWARRRRRNDPDRLPGLTITKRFFGGWTVLVVGGFVVAAIAVLVVVVQFANLIGGLPGEIKGCLNC
jgi:hypothetical protein